MTKREDAFVTALLQMRDRAMRLGLFATMQRIDAAVKQVGWELADKHKAKTA